MTVLCLLCVAFFYIVVFAPTVQGVNCIVYGASVNLTGPSEAGDVLLPSYVA